jgi:alpha/beta superfamily hydrolase
MDNNVINSLCDALSKKSFISLKFNFRGVNGSQGIFDNGIGEKDDVRSAITFISKLIEADQTRIGLVGYSAGAAWGLEAASQDSRVKAMAAVSPPLKMSDFAFLRDYTLPKFLIAGSQDDYVPPAPYKELCKALPEPKECYTISGADHFWLGHESEVSSKIVVFFTKTLLF